MLTWELTTTAVCDCGVEQQTLDHIVLLLYLPSNKER